MTFNNNYNKDAVTITGGNKYANDSASAGGVNIWQCHQLFGDNARPPQQPTNISCLL